MIGVLRSEYRKVISVREWAFVALVPVVLGMVTAAVAFPLLRAYRGEDSVGSDSYSGVAALSAPLALAVMFSGLFGALAIGVEFRHGTLSTSFVTVHRRDVVIGAKLVVAAGFGLALCLLTQIAVVPVLLAFGGEDFHIDGALFARFGSALLAAVAWSAIGSGVALLTRSATVAAVGILAWYTVGELVVRLVLGAIGADGLARGLPVSATAGAIVDAGNPDPVDSLPTYSSGLVLMAVWAVVIAGAGWALTRVRDLD